MRKNITLPKYIMYQVVSIDMNMTILWSVTFFAGFVEHMQWNENIKKDFFAFTALNKNKDEWKRWQEVHVLIATANIIFIYLSFRSSDFDSIAANIILYTSKFVWV